MIRLIILLLLSVNLNAQFLINSYAFNGSAPPPETTFDWNCLTWEPVITYNNPTGVLIDCKKYSNTEVATQFGSAIVVSGGDGMFEIKNSAFMQTDGEAVQFEDFGDGTGDTIWIHDCFFANGKNGISVVTGNAVIIIENNECINPHGAKGGKGQFVQFNSVTCQEGSIIRDNEIEIFQSEGYPEDLISMFNTGGSTGDTMYVRNNMSRGGGPSKSGGGFITGDGDGARVVIEDNILLNPGNYVVNVAGGAYNTIRNNTGYQQLFPYSNNIATYAYQTGASTFCNNITVSGNLIFLEKDNNYYCYCTPTCGDVTGIDEGEGNPDVGWLDGNSKSITGAAVAALFPSQFISFVPEDILFQIRDSGQIYRVTFDDLPDWPKNEPIPNTNAGSDQSISINNATFAGSSSGAVTPTYLWVQVSGPNTATITTPTSATSTVTGLIDGTYRFRLVTTDAAGNNNGSGIGSQDADWMEIVVLLL